MCDASRSPGADRAGEAYRCAVCGDPDLRCLCARCRLAHTDAGGALHPAIAAVQREAKRLSARLTRARRRGVAVVSLDRLDDPRGVN